MGRPNRLLATNGLAAIAPPGASAATIDALAECRRLREECMKAAANAPHMAKLRELVATSVPYGEEDSWSCSESDETWSPYGTIQKRHIRLPRQEKGVPSPSVQFQESTTREKPVFPRDRAPTVRRRYGIECYYQQISLEKQSNEYSKTSSTENKPVEEDQTSQSSSENNYTLDRHPSHQLASHHDPRQSCQDPIFCLHQLMLELSPRPDPQEPEPKDSGSESVKDFTPSAAASDSSNPTTATDIPTSQGITLSFAFRPTDHTAICEGKLGVIRDLENEEWQDEIRQRTASGLSKCTWRKTSAPPSKNDTNTSPGACDANPTLVLTTPEGQEHGLEDLNYYPGADWADLDGGEDD